MPHWSVKDPAPQAIRCRQPSPLRSRQSSGFLKEPNLVIELLAELAGQGACQRRELPRAGRQSRRTPGTIGRPSPAETSCRKTTATTLTTADRTLGLNPQPPLTNVEPAAA
jgi:hypothetical protein